MTDDAADHAPSAVSASAALPSADDAVRLATALLAESVRRRPRSERRRMARLGRMVSDPAGKAFTLALTDEVLRIRRPARAARQLRDLVGDLGVPTFPGPVDRAALWAGARLADRLPRVVMPLVVARIRRESAGVVIPAEPRAFARHAARRRAEGIDLNINVLGEAILGEEEAGNRVGAVLAQLRRPDVDYVSVKISSAYSQVSVLAFEDTVAEVARRLRPLYAEAARHRPAKFVNLDMEEYRDLSLTTAVLQAVLNEPEFHTLDAGIVLQAYLPDSMAVLGELCTWAARRRDAGGGDLKVRIVKGANLAMELVDAEMHGWEPATFADKASVDANYKRMLDAALDGGVRIGVASHNLFDVAWALLLRDARHAAERVDLEMLEGMAEGQALAARAAAGGLRLYAPVARRDDVESSIAYLARRLDENTGPDNFLRHVFSLRPGSRDFLGERDRFLAAVSRRAEPVSPPRRTQDRSAPVRQFLVDEPFANEPDTDFSLARNRAWLDRALAVEFPEVVAAVVGGSEVHGPAWALGINPSHPGESLYRYTLADAGLVDRAVAVARAGARTWGGLPSSERRRILTAVATAMAAGRDRSIAAMVRDAGKTVAEADPEVSEAVDFARYYAASTRLVESLTDVSAEPVGTVVVAPPWNFPYSIPAGGVLAALAAGNAVILKPAPETVLTAAVLAQHCWEGGVPTDALQFLPCPDDDVGRHLITHPDVDAVVLTGSIDTARLFMRWKPDLRLYAETSGKNAIVVTAAADIDAAIRDIVRSAFGSAGQKCSAASLAVVEADVLDDPAFLRRLADATRSLKVGPSEDLPTMVGPLIRPPSGPLERALTVLDHGESWLVRPTMVGANPHLWSPGVKIGVAPGSWFHETECFGPVLGVMRAEDLAGAVRIQNATAFGLTGGIQSLDHREIDSWLEAVEVGNAYVNRHITGAIVGRQPFGGWKNSSVGPGAKAGGPNQVFTLIRFRQVAPPHESGPVPPQIASLVVAMSKPLAADDAAFVEAAARSLGRLQASEFAVGHDPSGLRAEANVLRYRRRRGPILVRAGAGTAERDLAIAVLAARLVGVPIEVSSAEDRPGLAGVVEVVVEDDERLAGRLPGRLAVPGWRGLRLLGSGDGVVHRAAADAGIEVDDTPVLANGRLELLRWYDEQAVSVTLHRYGSVTDRNGPRAPRVVSAAGS